MLKLLNKKNTHDSLNKYHWLKSSDQTKLVQTVINSNYNLLTKNTKLISELTHYYLYLLHQKPKVLISSKSIAAFKVRMSWPIGVKTNLRGLTLNNFYLGFVTSILPLSEYQNNNFKVNKRKSDSNYLISFRLGIEDFTNPLLDRYALSGGIVQFDIISPVKTIPFYYFNLKS